MYNVLIVDDQRSSQDFMKLNIMPGADRYTIVDTIASADRALSTLINIKVDLILLDIFTDNKANGLIAAREIKQLYPHIKIIIMTFLLQQKHLDEAKAIGCDGFCYKDFIEENLLTAMDIVMQGKKYFPDDTPKVEIGMAKSSDFTQKEIEVLQAKVNGLSNKEVCELLNIKSRTLDGHISSLKAKTGYESLLKLIADVVSKNFVIINEED